MTATKAEPGGAKKEQLERRIVVDMLTAGGAYTHITNRINSFES
ncbi:hypothetical protein [Heyndrickxia coagulans]|nr:hypothetical protein [Heyndrickxia coagulans]